MPGRRHVAAVVAILPFLPAVAPIAVGAELPPRRGSAARAPGPIIVDGRLDEAAWSAATPIEDLTQYQPGDGVTPTQRTEIRVLFDDENVYFGVRLWDTQIEDLRRNQMLQGQTVVNDDYLQLIIDPLGMHRDGYLFYVNANGVQRDGLTFGSAAFNMDWDTIWQAQTSIDEEGWTAEIAIPFRSLTYDPASDVWSINFIRSIRRNQEEIAWGHRDRRVTLDAAGLLTGIEAPRPRAAFDVVPSAVLSRRRDFRTDRTDEDFEPSVDAFWRITPRLTATGTLNTDFSSVEVDDRQVNLTRFPLFFPEKRDFFLEDAGVFEFGGIAQNARPFFSRTIGLSPLGTPVNLRGGAKLTGRAGPVSLGYLAVQQEEEDGLTDDWLFVGRSTVNVLEQSTIGGIVTLGDPRVDRGAALYGVDAFFRDTNLVPNRAVEARLWLQRSDVDDVAGDEEAWGALLAYPNDRVNASIGVLDVGREFRPTLGFVNRLGIRQYDGTATYKHRFGGGPLRWNDATVQAQEVRAHSGGLDSRLLRIAPVQLSWNTGDSAALNVLRETDVLDRPFVLPGAIVVPPGRYEWDRWRVQAATAASRDVSVQVRYEGGDFYSGDRTEWFGSAEWRPSRHLALAASYTWNELDLPEGSFITRLMTLRASAAFNVRWSWINFVQYDNVSRQLGLNSRLRYIPRLGREALLVLNHGSLRTPEDEWRSEVSDVTFKASYTLRF